MRRSAAPSQKGSATKKPRFVCPFVKLPNDNVGDPSPVSEKSAATEPAPGLVAIDSSNTSTVAIPHVPVSAVGKEHSTENDFVSPQNKERSSPSKSAIQYKENVPCTTQSADRLTVQSRLAPKFRAPSASTVSQTLQPVAPSVQQASDEAPVSHYYSVVWCKLSKKKHKNWEGDAVLITRGRSVTLKDIEGKEIGKGTGYRKTDMESMQDGHTLVVGGKEVEVMGCISTEHYMSGKCFQTASTTVDNTLMSSAALTAPPKPFVRPQKVGADVTNVSVKKVALSVRPRHDPTSPGALVMPTPSRKHQKEYNKSGLPLVDVVVDPYLSVYLRPHQREGVTFLYECLMDMRDYMGCGAILADHMGLGKTLQCISVIWTLYKQGVYGGKPSLKRILIVTPGSLVQNWCNEFKKWLGKERMAVFAVTSEARVDEFARSPVYPVMVVSYEMLMKCHADVSGVKFDLIVCDEGHRLKNAAIKTTTLINSLDIRRRIVLTGTPVQNDLQEFFALVDFCNPGVLGSSATFRRVYEEAIVRSRQPGASGEERHVGEARAAELGRLTAEFVMRRTQDVNNRYLPPRVEMVVFCQPSTLQLSIYRQLLQSRAVKSCLKQYDTDGSCHLVCISALKKLCNHPMLVHQAALQTDAAEERAVVTEGLYAGVLPLFPSGYGEEGLCTEDSGKLTVLSELLSSLYRQTPVEKIVVVSSYTQTLDILQELCVHEGYRFLRLDGATPTGRRQDLVEQFNSRHGQEFVFLLSCKAGGQGINLIGASRIVLYDIDWNPANDLQAMARVWRDGQRRTVHIYRLLTTGSIEEKVYQRQVSKQGLSGAVVDAKTLGKVQFSKDDLKDLFKLSQGTPSTTHDLLDCECHIGQSRPPVSHRNLAAGVAIDRMSTSLSMDELMDWEHHAAPINYELMPGSHLKSAVNTISFVFRNVANEQAKPGTVAE
ncbi:PREDICTED: DNA repair and recombination protein RAD54B-like [Priapulus caudatus]|uniref:DNA repair and recombination protein RAD54-like n=1 Tax=Priapulus caudatus TaxID=37621 RepID=A0ABM1DY70_PRICU|nr:PREDICTED: DNA repair and recombination protein RAD54B-like [Priapulus caudatus]XP_014664892.1 PREDICTED: DNA repair and recombination protein RAD54B-like [Priapulus caudatus]XP_014664894.1 PREDICTED: DNA repair and recombination protein RAD54B-like [Priapulus caudatus]